MGKKNSNKLTTGKKMKTRYAFSVLNESNLEEVYRKRLTGYDFMFIIISALILLFVIFTLIMAFTPLKRILPADEDTALRNRLISQAITIDSLQRVTETNQNYLDNITDIFSGKIKIEENDDIDSLIVKIYGAQFIDKSDEEKVFNEKFEEEEMYNFANRDVAEASMVFFSPVRGSIVRNFDVGEGHLGTDISTNEGAAISAVYDGVVLSSGYDASEGYVLEILHKDNYVSVYRGAAESFKRSGDAVKTGESIGLTGKNSLHGAPVLHFELWKSMQPQNPADYITFE